MQNTINYLLNNQFKSNPKTRSQFFQSNFSNSKSLFSKNLKGHLSCVNAIEFSKKDSNFLISGKKNKI